MHEGFDGERSSGVDVAYLLQRKLSRHDDLRISRLFEQCCPLRCAIVHLRGGVESYGGKAER